MNKEKLSAEIFENVLSVCKKKFAQKKLNFLVLFKVSGTYHYCLDKMFYPHSKIEVIKTTLFYNRICNCIIIKHNLSCLNAYVFKSYKLISNVVVGISIVS